MRPGEYAEKVISLEDAYSRFVKRFEHGRTVFLARHLGAKHAADNLRRISQAYQWIWAG